MVPPWLATSLSNRRERPCERLLDVRAPHVPGERRLAEDLEGLLQHRFRGALVSHLEPQLAVRVQVVADLAVAAGQRLAMRGEHAREERVRLAKAPPRGQQLRERQLIAEHVPMSFAEQPRLDGDSRSEERLGFRRTLQTAEHVPEVD